MAGETAGSVFLTTQAWGQRSRDGRCAVGFLTLHFTVYPLRRIQANLQNSLEFRLCILFSAIHCRQGLEEVTPPFLAQEHQLIAT